MWAELKAHGRDQSATSVAGEGKKKATRCCSHTPRGLVGGAVAPAAAWRFLFPVPGELLCEALGVGALPPDTSSRTEVSPGCSPVLPLSPRHVLTLRS